MANLVTILFLISVIGLLIGIFKPDLILKRVSNEKWNRKKLIKVFAGFSLVLFILTGIIGMSEEESDKIIKEELDLRK